MQVSKELHSHIFPSLSLRLGCLLRSKLELRSKTQKFRSKLELPESFSKEEWFQQIMLMETQTTAQSVNAITKNRNEEKMHRNTIRIIVIEKKKSFWQKIKPLPRLNIDMIVIIKHRNFLPPLHRLKLPIRSRLLYKFLHRRTTFDDYVLIWCLTLQNINDKGMKEKSFLYISPAWYFWKKCQCETFSLDIFVPASRIIYISVYLSVCCPWSGVFGRRILNLS